MLWISLLKLIVNDSSASFTTHSIYKRLLNYLIVLQVCAYYISTRATSQSPVNEMVSGSFTLKFGTVLEGNISIQLLLGKVMKNCFALSITAVDMSLNSNVI